jgi:hypothetical protein
VNVERGGRNPQQVRVDVRAIDPEDILDAGLSQDLQPRRGPAPDVDDAARSDEVDDEGNDASGRTRSALPRSAVETLRVHVHENSWPT